jgi:tRNA-binding protein
MAETFQEYTARLLSLSDGLDPFAVLVGTPGRIGALIAGRGVEELQWRPADGRWSIAQLVSHLADADIVFAYRARMILSAPGRPIEAYDQNDWVASQHAERSDAHASLALFRALRLSTVRLLRSLTEEELDRYGVHAERGRESLRHLLALHAGHDRNHLAQIERLAAESAPARAYTPAPLKEEIDQATLEKVDVRAGTIRSAAEIPGADRLALLTVDFGDRTRSIVAGIRTERPALDALAGLQAFFVVNLPHKMIRGQLSEGMLFDAGFADGLRPAFLQPEWPIPDGVRAG